MASGHFEERPDSGLPGCAWAAEPNPWPSATDDLILQPTRHQTTRSISTSDLQGARLIIYGSSFVANLLSSSPNRPQIPFDDRLQMNNSKQLSKGDVTSPLNLCLVRFACVDPLPGQLRRAVSASSFIIFSFFMISYYIYDLSATYLLAA